MSELNILDPTSGSEMSPDYGYKISDGSSIGRFKPRSGPPKSRLLQGSGRMFSLIWEKRPSAIKFALDQWERQYRGDFFTYYDVDSGRYFSGQFVGSLNFTHLGNEQYSIEGVFEECMGLPLYQYPGENSLATNAAMWLRDGIFLEERNGLGQDNVKLTGAWAYEVNAIAHGGANYYSPSTDDAAEWLYFGYGFRYWSLKRSGAGIAEVSLDGVIIGTADGYSAANVASAPLLVKVDVPLGMHRVKVRCTGTKNGASAGFQVRADAIEVMQ